MIGRVSLESRSKFNSINRYRWPHCFTGTDCWQCRAKHHSSAGVVAHLCARCTNWARNDEGEDENEQIANIRHTAGTLRVVSDTSQHAAGGELGRMVGYVPSVFFGARDST